MKKLKSLQNTNLSNVLLEMDVFGVSNNLTCDFFFEVKNKKIDIKTFLLLYVPDYYGIMNNDSVPYCEREQHIRNIGFNIPISDITIWYSVLRNFSPHS